MARILAFSAVVELATGLVLLADPALVVSLLLGVDASAAVTWVGRCFGVALLALGVACWPSHSRSASDSAVLRAPLIYNAGIALYLAYLGAAAHVGGPLLWPAVALHAGVAVALLFPNALSKRARSD